AGGDRCLRTIDAHPVDTGGGLPALPGLRARRPHGSGAPLQPALRLLESIYRAAEAAVGLAAAPAPGYRSARPDRRALPVPGRSRPGAELAAEGPSAPPAGPDPPVSPGAR